jgi:hypothetical protein
MPSKNAGEPPAEGEAPAETQLTTRGAFRHIFRHIYCFILQAVKGDKTTADTIFEDYLAGKLSEELLSISRRCVSADQAGSSNRDIDEGWRRDKLRVGRGAGVSEDAPHCAFVSTSKLRIVRVNAHTANETHTRSKYCRKSNGPIIVWLKSKSGWWTSNNITVHLLISGCSTVTMRGRACARTSCPPRQT